LWSHPSTRFLKRERIDIELRASEGGKAHGHRRTGDVI
jgi:hypothetical protein